MLQSVLGRDLGLSDGVMAEVNGVGYLDLVRRPWGVFLAAVVLQGHAQAPPVFALKVPRVACVWLQVRYDAAPKGPHWRGVIVERASKILPGRDLWVHCGLAQEVQCHLCLGDEQVPRIPREIGSHACKDG